MKNACFFFLLLAGNVWTLPAGAQNSVPAATATATVRRIQSPAPVIPPPVMASNSLAALMTRAEPPRSGVALAVDAENIPALPTANALREHPGLNLVADATNRLIKRFGGVTALASPSMVVLNPNPTDPNPFDGMPTEDALALLAASLSPAQWAALTSARGLGASDLTTFDQRDLFRALFPADQQFLLLGGGQETDVTKQLGAARLRLTQKTDIQLQLSSQEASIEATGYDGTSSSGSEGKTLTYGNLRTKEEATRYQLEAQSDNEKNTMFGVEIRAEVPNAPKRGDLNFDALQVSVPVTKIKTVKELVTRVGLATHLEIYADARMEPKSVTIVGAETTATAADLLRALAFCLTGTYRQVGPAYVLTDDVLGYGTRLQRLAMFTEKADKLRNKTVGEARDKLVRAKVRDAIGDLGANLTPTPEQNKKNLRPEPDFGSITQVTLHRADLNAAQQAAVTQMEAELTRVKATPPPLPNGDVVLRSLPQLEVLLPGLDAPVVLNSVSAFILFQPSNKLSNELWEAQNKIDAEKRARTSVKKPPVDLRVAMQLTPRRVIIASPASMEEADKLLAVMQKIGFNQLWIPVSIDGKDDALLSAILKAGKAAKIVVLPVLDIFRWQKPAPSAALDLTILGETSAANPTFGYVLGSDSDDDALPPAPPPTVWVSPFSPGVADALRERLRTLSALPGVPALVWRALQPPGYRASDDNSNSVNSDDLGYTPLARLAFLRQSHADPIDLTDGFSLSVDANLPNLSGNAQIDEKLRKQWQAARFDSSMTLLRGLRESVKLPVVTTVVSSSGNWYGTWESAARPLPRSREWNGEGSPQAIYTQAKAQSKIALNEIDSWSGYTLEQLTEVIGMSVRTVKFKRWDGIVFDLTPGAGEKPLGKNGVPMLTKLAESITGKPSKS